MKATIRFDGGCRGNPGQKYGSYEVRISSDVVASESRFELGHGTNNEAEWEALIRALSSLRDWLWKTGFYVRDIELHIFTDSMIVRNRLMKKNKIHKKPAWKSRSEVMFNYAKQVRDVLVLFKSFTVEWERRDANVATFGH